jgi:Glycosyltransferase family 87
MTDSSLKTTASADAPAETIPAVNVRGFGATVKRALRVLIAFAMIAIALAVLIISMSGSENAAHKDLISYWAAGRLLLRHANPYDAAAVFRLEKSAGFNEPEPLVMWNTPYALFLTIPPALLSPTIASILWSLLIVASIVVSIRLLWIIHGRPPDRLHLLGYLFAPAFACMEFGQSSSFILFGIVGFLCWHRRRPFLAGLCLPLLAIKPHLLLPFGFILLAWIVARRAYRVLLGTILGAALAMALPLWLRPSLWSDYLPIFHTAAANSARLPIISSLARIAIAPRLPWVQFLPAIFGGIWAAAYFLRHKSDWDWNHHGPLLLAVSVFVAPYSWFPDEIVVLPAMLAALYCCAERDRSLLGFALLDLAALLLLFTGVRVQSGAFIWTTAAWLGWYLFATRSSGDQPVLSPGRATG